MSLSLYSWNVNGIRAVLKKGALQNLIDTQNPDILCLQETKIQPSQIDFKLENYHAYFNGAQKAGYSGTAILSKQKAQKVLYNFTDDLAQQFDLNDQFGNLNQEGRVISAEFVDFWLVNVYTPNSKRELLRLDSRQRWDQAFLKHLTNLQTSKPVLFCGDLNVAHQAIDLARPKQNEGKHGFTNEERAGFDGFIKNGFVDIFRRDYPTQGEAYTWWTHWANARQNNVGWRIDYWLADRNLAKRVKNPQIHNQILGSDHCPVSIELTKAC